MIRQNSAQPRCNALLCSRKLVFNKKILDPVYNVLANKYNQTEWVRLLLQEVNKNKVGSVRAILGGNNTMILMFEELRDRLFTVNERRYKLVDHLRLNSIDVNRGLSKTSEHITIN